MTTSPNGLPALDPAQLMAQNAQLNKELQIIKLTALHRVLEGLRLVIALAQAGDTGAQMQLRQFQERLETVKELTGRARIHIPPGTG